MVRVERDCCYCRFFKGCLIRDLSSQNQLSASYKSSVVLRKTTAKLAGLLSRYHPQYLPSYSEPIASNPGKKEGVVDEEAKDHLILSTTTTIITSSRR